MWQWECKKTNEGKKTHKKGLLKMKSSAINRVEIEVPEKGWFIHTHSVPKSKDNTNWNTYMKYIHTYILCRYVLYIYTLSKRGQAAVQHLGRSKCSTFSKHTHTCMYMYSHVCLCMCFRLFSMLLSAIFSCILLRQTTLRMRNFQLPDWWKFAKQIKIDLINRKLTCCWCKSN